jgi:hypothetical protein
MVKIHTSTHIIMSNAGIQKAVRQVYRETNHPLSSQLTMCPVTKLGATSAQRRARRSLGNQWDSVRRIGPQPIDCT